ncbi:ABC transporter permease [Undibacter mobilis]|uniref:ABC transporter permease n=1 Tax=Undibacter mobilis TaxID=2292256 RepID=A0A371B3B0_9BRAD|nr:ABC transporter permease [Undibacter mobilis]RDV01987.1 ABC transporter permease [Undibacter mobilis]
MAQPIGAAITQPESRADEPPGRRRLSVLFASRLLRGLIVPAVILAVWQLAAATGWAPSSSIPSPAAVIESWYEWIAGPVTPLAWYSGTWGTYALLSVRRVAAGFAIASAAGATFGLMLGWYALMNDLFENMVNFLRAIPTTAWVPFVVFFFGIHETAAISLIAFGAFFPIATNIAAGARQTPRTLIRAARMLGTPARKVLWRVVLPSTLPAVFAGLRIGLGLSWVLVIVAEMLAVQGGLGYALWSAYQVNRLDLIVAAIISVGLFGLFSDWLLVSLSNMSLRWQRGLVGR